MNWKKKLLIGTAAVAIAAGGYFAYRHSTQQPPTEEITIASFNIQSFGQKKAEDPELSRILAGIVENFDLVAVQEVHRGAMPLFMTRLGGYDYIQSTGLGRSKEEYAFLYRRGKVKFDSSHLSANAEFERPPFFGKFRSGKFSYVLADMHVKPTAARSEISHLREIMDEGSVYDKHVIALGDFNADCSYFDERTKPPEYFWIIPDEADTTVKTNCTYDRIVIPPETKRNYAGEWGVYNFLERNGLSREQGARVSDHFPVWAKFYTDRDTDN